MAFEGTVIVVSHDRYFLNRVVDQLLVLDGDGRVQVIHGNYDTYELMRTRQRTTAANRARSGHRSLTVAARNHPPQTNRQSANAVFPIARWKIWKPTSPARRRSSASWKNCWRRRDLYRDGDKVKETMRDFEETKARLQQLYEHWEEAVELN